MAKTKKQKLDFNRNITAITEVEWVITQNTSFRLTLCLCLACSLQLLLLCGLKPHLASASDWLTVVHGPPSLRCKMCLLPAYVKHACKSRVVSFLLLTSCQLLSYSLHSSINECPILINKKSEMSTQTLVAVKQTQHSIPNTNMLQLFLEECPQRYK